MEQSNDRSRHHLLIERNIDQYLRTDRVSPPHALERLRKAIHYEELHGAKARIGAWRGNTFARYSPVSLPPPRLGQSISDENLAHGDWRVEVAGQCP